MYTLVSQLSDKWQNLLNRLEENEGVLDEDTKQELSKLEADKDNVVERLAGSVNYYLSLDSACRKESENQLERAAKHKKHAENTKKFLHTVIQFFGGKSLPSGNIQYKTPLVTVNESKSVKVEITDVNLIPQDYKSYSVTISGLTLIGKDWVLNRVTEGIGNVSMSTEEKIDKEAISRFLKQAMLVPGATLIENKTIQIK